MTLSTVSIGNLFIWKNLVLNEAARAFTDPGMQQIQMKTGVWEHGSKINYPKASDISVIENGCLTFLAPVGKEDILFSIWMQPGEVRAGVKIPNTYIATTSNKETISKMINGQPCQRISPMEKHTFFDWIWVNQEFASFDFMVKSIEDEMLASVLAERIAQIVTHLHLATISTLISMMKFKIVEGRIIQDGLDVWKAVVAGDMDALKWFLDRNGGTLVEQKNGENQYINCTFQIPVERKKLVESNRGQVISEPDGGQCKLVHAILSPNQ